MTPITVNGHTLLVIDVPKDITKFKISGTNFLCEEYKGHWIVFNDEQLPSGFKYSIIGTISKEGEFSFDPSEYVKRLGRHEEKTNTDVEVYFDYFDYTKDDFTEDLSFGKNKSFISLLESARIYLCNPMGEKPLKMNYTVGIKDFDRDRYKDDVSQWESYESKTIKGQVLILKQEKV